GREGPRRGTADSPRGARRLHPCGRGRAARVAPSHGGDAAVRTDPRSLTRGISDRPRRFSRAHREPAGPARCPFELLPGAERPRAGAGRSRARGRDGPFEPVRISARGEMTMRSTARRPIAVVLGLVVIAGLVAAAYTFRGRLRPQHEDHETVARAPAAPPPPQGASVPSSSTVARGDVTIDSQRQQLIGVRIATVSREVMAAVVRTTGAVRYDETRLADVNVKLDGWIRDLRVDYTGQPVQKGQPLFTFYSPDLLATQNEYLLALKTRDQMKGSAVPDAREYADRVVEAARQRLVLRGVAPEDITALEEQRQAQDVIVVRSAVSGYVIEKKALQGMHITAGQTLYKVADLSVVWVEADVYEQEMAHVRVGQPATVRLDAYPA